MSETPHIVLIDDDQLFRDAVSAGLQREGFTVTSFGDGPTALAHLVDNGGWRAADVIVLDWRMPVMDGPQVLERLRAAGAAAPVIMLTSLTDQVYEETALGAGAVDFVDKERSVGILAQRLRLAAARGGAVTVPADDDGAGLAIGQLDLDLSARRARWRSKEIDLTLTEFDLVALIARRPGRDVTYRELYDLVHGSGFQSGSGADGYRSNVRGFIKRIRRKFEISDSDFDAIENYPGFGYRWRKPDET